MNETWIYAKTMNTINEYYNEYSKMRRHNMRKKASTPEKRAEAQVFTSNWYGQLVNIHVMRL